MNDPSFDVYGSLRIKFSTYVDLEAGHFPLVAAEVARIANEMKANNRPVIVVDDDTGVQLFEL